MLIPFDTIKSFYTTHLPGGHWKGHYLEAECPFCPRSQAGSGGRLAVMLNPNSFFRGYFKCSKTCVPGGFQAHFGRLAGLEGAQVPGFDPDAESYASSIPYPARHLGTELDQFRALMGEAQRDYFARYGVGAETLHQMQVGFNGRYLVFPYFQENGHAYAAHCILPNREQDQFWHGNDAFSQGEPALYNAGEIGYCEGGALFVTHGELNLLILKSLGYPAIAVPSATDLAGLSAERLERIEHLFVVVAHTPEAHQAAREFAVRIGFKSRILVWPAQCDRGTHLSQMAADPAMAIKATLQRMIRHSKAFSPFGSPEKERQRFLVFLEQEKGRTLMGIPTGFAKMDRHLEGLRGINIVGGPPKAGKSCFFMQVSSEIARLQTPVIYYDFENGRQKIYLRTLVRLSGLPEKGIRSGRLNPEQNEALANAQEELVRLLTHFRVVNDRRLTPDIMRRHIDFIKHEIRKDDLLVVVDSLHKLPFKDLTERRTGIDSWLRQLEAIRDEQQVCFLVISELSRGKGGGYGEKPDLSSFKESGDIEYSADNAMMLMPDWDPLAPVSEGQRKSTLWVVASREASPGRVAEYVLDYPYWRFREQ